MGRSIESRNNHNNGEKRHDREIHKARVFAVAPIRVEQFERLLDLGDSPNDIPLVGVVLALKSDKSERSGGLVMPLGGNVRKDKGLLDEAMLEVYHKSFLLSESELKTHEMFNAIDPLPIWYQLAGKSTVYDARCMVIPVRSGDMSVHDPRFNDGDADQIKELVFVSPAELAQLFIHGYTQMAHGEKFTIVGHLTQAASNDVTLLSGTRQNQRIEFARILDEVHQYEEGLRRAILDKVNFDRRLRAKPEVSHMGECGREELMSAFVWAQMRLGMNDERMRDERQMSQPAPAADKLTAALYLSAIQPDHFAEGLMPLPTAELRRVRNKLYKALREPIRILFDEMNEDLSPFSHGTKDHRRAINILAALAYIWPKVVELPIVQRGAVKEHVNMLFKQELAAMYGVNIHDIEQARKIAENISSYYISEELRGSKIIHQQPKTLNELTGAGLFSLILYSVGLHPNRVLEHERDKTYYRMLRGEAMIMLSHFFTDMDMVKQPNNNLFQDALDAITDSPPISVSVPLGHGIHHPILYRRLRVPIDGKHYTLVLDERHAKKREREIIKNYQTKENNDTFAVNFALGDVNFEDEHEHDPLARLELAEKVRDVLVDSIKAQYAGTGYEVTIVEGTEKRESLDWVRRYLSLSTDREREAFARTGCGGRRSGSQGDRIVRIKFVIAISNGVHTQKTEVSVFPFWSIKTAGGKLAKSKRWGLKEKNEDDERETYRIARVRDRDTRKPLRPSVIESVKQAILYENDKNRFVPFLRTQHKPKRKKKR